MENELCLTGVEDMVGVVRGTADEGTASEGTRVAIGLEVEAIVRVIVGITDVDGVGTTTPVGGTENGASY